MDIIYDLMYDVILPHYVMMAQKKHLTSKHIQRKTETNHKCQTQKQRIRQPGAHLPRTQKKHNKKDLKKKEVQVATLEVHRCKTVPYHHCHRPGFDLTNCWSSPRRQFPTPRRGSMERLTDGAGKPGRTWAKRAEQHATCCRKRVTVRCFCCLCFLGRGWFSWKNFGFFSKWPKRWLFFGK